MPNSDIDVGSEPTTKPHCYGSSNRQYGMRRKAEILDSLVLMIVGFLLPAWLLGHLFLSFYPAPLSPSTSSDGDPRSRLTNSSGSADVDLIAAAIDKAEPLNNSKVDGNLSSDANLDSHDDQNANPEAPNPLQEKLDSLSNKFKMLTIQSAGMQAILDSFETKNKELQAKIKSLQSNNSFVPPVKKKSNDENDSKIVKQLQSQLFEISAKLKTEGASIDDGQTKLLAEANQKITTLQQALNSLTKKFKTATSTLADREQDLQTSKQAVQNPNVANNNLQAALDSNMLQLTPVLSPPEVYREFISSKGNPARMAFLRWENEKIVFLNFANKKLYWLPLSRFSEADQKYLLEKK